MAYTRTNWVDRNIQYPKRYTLTLVSGNTYDLTPVTGTVVATGTPVNATNLNKIEDGLELIDKRQRTTYQIFMSGWRF